MEYEENGTESSQFALCSAEPLIEQGLEGKNVLKGEPCGWFLDKVIFHLC